MVLCFIDERGGCEKEKKRGVTRNSAFPLDMATDFGQTAAKLLMAFLARLILKNLGSSWFVIGHKFLCTLFFVSAKKKKRGFLVLPVSRKELDKAMFTILQFFQWLLAIVVTRTNHFYCIAC